MLKDWKKIGEDEWEKGNIKVSVWKGEYSKAWRCNITTESINSYNEYDSKNKAISYAKNYMRTH